MGKGKLFVLAVSFLALIIVGGCDNPNFPATGAGCGSAGTDTGTATSTNTATNSNVETDTNTSTTPGDPSSVTNIVLNGNSIAADTANAVVNGSVVTITSAGSYNISGSLTNGQIIVDAPDTDTVTLNLNGVNIKSSTSAPIFAKKSDKVIIVLGDNTQNTLTDATSYTLASGEDEPNAPLFSKDDLTIKGNGALTVNGNYNDGIASKNDLRIKGGTITVKAADDGLRGKDSIEISGGVITVTAAGDGLKSDNAEEAERGVIQVEGGKLTVTATGDGIAAQTEAIITDGQVNITTGGGSNSKVSGDASAKGIKGNVGVAIDGGTITLNCADDGIHSDGDIDISGGTITIASADDAIHAEVSVDVNGGDIRITKSYEGIEAATITFNNGNVNLVSSDDGINGVAAGAPSSNMNVGGGIVRIHGGYIAMNAGGDGLDCNGTMEMTGGTAIVHGPTANNNGPMDYSSFKITGGLIVAVGSSGMAQIAGSSSSGQNALLLNFTSSQRAGNLINIQTSTGQSVLTFQPAKTYQSITFSSPELTNGSYKVYTGGSSTGTVKDGLYTGGTYTPGTQYTTFTVSGRVTTVGSTGRMMR